MSSQSPQLQIFGATIDSPYKYTNDLSVGSLFVWRNGKGDLFWFIKSEPDIHHREDGPAVERVDGTKEWFFYNKRHREDGPAIEHTDGSKKWYLKGEELKLKLPKYILINYMKANNLTVAHLFTDPDPLVRKSVSKYKWKESK
jgi:hypothetical protein